MQKITLYSLSFASLLYLVCSVFALNMIWGVDLGRESDLAVLLDFGGQLLFVFLVAICGYVAWKYYFDVKYKHALMLIFSPLCLYIVVFLFSNFFLS